nr:hypothetical protein [Stenotrophomonas maltophilia]
MNRNIILIGIALLICSCGNPADHEQGSDQQAGSDSVSEDLLNSPGVGLPLQRAEGLVDRAKVETYLCGMNCSEAGPLEAGSPKEAAWLIKHGYPSAAEKFRLESLSRDALRQEVESGSLPGAVEYGRRLALEENMLDGKIVLREQAQSGNIFAYYGLAAVSANGSPPSLVDTAAYLRMAYMLGDDRAALEIAKMRLTSAELVAADKRASHLFSGYAGEQLRDPRPQD